jgi:hypothetical protein
LILTGYVVDHDYNRTESEYRKEKGIPDDMELNKKTFVDFPIERSRLRSIWWIVLVFIATTALYRFFLSLNQITLSLLLQFFIAYVATAVFFNSALVIDLYWRLRFSNRSQQLDAVFCRRGRRRCHPTHHRQHWGRLCVPDPCGAYSCTVAVVVIGVVLWRGLAKSED